MTDWNKPTSITTPQRRLLAKIIGLGTYRPTQTEWQSAYVLLRLGFATKLDFEIRPTERGLVEHKRHAP